MQALTLLVVLGGVGWVCYRLNRDEVVERMGIEEQVWKKGREALAAKRKRPVWERRLLAYWRRGETVRKQRAA